MIRNYNFLSSSLKTVLKSGVGDKLGSPPISNSKATKSSWLVLVLMFLSLTFGQLTNAQSLANYAYATGTNGSLEDLSSGSTSYLVGNNDDVAGIVQPLNFPITFMGTIYTHFSANSNGQMQLHTSSSATAISANQSPASGVALFAPFLGDNEVNNGLRYKIIGTAPNRKFVMEWNQFYVNFINLTNAGNMQVWIQEGTGVVTYMYGEIYNSSNTSQTRSILYLLVQLQPLKEL